MEHQLIVRSHLSDVERLRLDRRVSSGKYRRILPGVYSSDGRETWLQRVQATQLRFTGAVLCGRTAAKLQFWDELEFAQVHASGVRAATSPDWLSTSRGVVPSVLQVEHHNLRLTAPALTVLDLIPEMGGHAIDEALRRRVVTLGGLADALTLTPGRPGNQNRARLIADSRNHPWSELERLGHRLLRKHGFTGWFGNHPIRVGWQLYYADVAFVAAKLIIEFDGWRHHRTREDLNRDNRRQNALVLAGWTVLRFTWDTLDEMPEQVRRFLKKQAGAKNRAAR